MTADRFGPWSARSKQGFVDQQVASGTAAPPEAREYAEREFAALLADGLDTADHHLWSVYDGHREIGTVWLWVRDRPAGREAFLLEIELDEDVRGTGLGAAAMRATEAAARELGAVRLRLNVFGHNTAARRLYAGLGYTVLDTFLAGPGGAPDHPGDAPDRPRIAAELLEKQL